VDFSQDLQADVMSRHVTVTFRLWRRPNVKTGGRYRAGTAQIEVDSIEQSPSPPSTKRTCAALANPTSSHFANEPLTLVPSATKPSCIRSNFTSSG